jgi:hypothetical protein
VQFRKNVTLAGVANRLARPYRELEYGHHHAGKPCRDVLSSFSADCLDAVAPSHNIF